MNSEEFKQALQVATESVLRSVNDSIFKLEGIKHLAQWVFNQEQIKEALSPITDTLVQAQQELLMWYKELDEQTKKNDEQTESN